MLHVLACAVPECVVVFECGREDWREGGRDRQRDFVRYGCDARQGFKVYSSGLKV